MAKMFVDIEFMKRCILAQTIPFFSFEQYWIAEFFLPESKIEYLHN